jgi:preprotein translocase subunit SecY
MEWGRSEDCLSEDAVELTPRQERLTVTLLLLFVYVLLEQVPVPL